MQLHNLSDVLIGLAYLAIPISLVLLTRRRRDIPFRGVFWMFGAFIVSCGMTHFLEAFTFYRPVYRFTGLVKLETALISWATVAALVPLIPKVVSLRSPEELAAEVTRRRRAEEALREANAELEARVEARTADLERALAVLDAWMMHAPIGLSVLDRELRFVRVNRALAEINGVSIEGHLGRTISEVLPGLSTESREAHRRTLETAEPDLEREVVEDRLPGSVGDPRHFLLSQVPIRTHDGDVFGLGVVVQEVTERRRAQLELARSEARHRALAESLQESDRRKDEFLATLAHELRNPLAPIRNAAEVMRRRGLADPALEYERAIIERQVTHLARLVDDLLDISRINSGKIKLQPTHLDLGTVIARAVEACRPALEMRGHTLNVSVPEPPPPVFGDLTRLAQVVANLLNNAIKYTPPGGRIDVEAAAEGETAVVRVRDNGVGIGPDLLPRVFDLFAQGDVGLARTEGGLGIGLSLVKTLVERHGGMVEASSSGEGWGSTFTVRLPLDREPVPTSVENGAVPNVSDSTVTESNSMEPRRVLLVDDNVDAALSLARLLALEGNEVRVAHDGPTGLAETEGWPPDAVVLDIGLPGMDGYQVARELRRRSETVGDGSCPVLIAATGYGQEADRLRAREAGFDVHLVKPIDPDVLADLLRAAPIRPRSEGASR